MASQDRNIFRLSLCPSSYDSVEPSSFVSFSVEHKHGRSLDSLRGIWMCLTSGVCNIYYAFPGRPAFLMKRSADVLTSHLSHTSSVPPASSSLVTLHVQIHPWTTVDLTCGPFAKGLELPIGLTASRTPSDLAPLDIGLATVLASM